MCVVCGCNSKGEAAPAHPTPAAGGAVVDARTGDLHFGAGAARVSVPGLSESRAIRIEQDVLGANNQVAQQNRAHFHAHGVRALNLVSSPGSGKTTLLCATIRALQQQHPELPLAVIFITPLTILLAEAGANMQLPPDVIIQARLIDIVVGSVIGVVGGVFLHNLSLREWVSRHLFRRPMPPTQRHQA